MTIKQQIAKGIYTKIDSKTLAKLIIKKELKK